MTQKTTQRDPTSPVTVESSELNALLNELGRPQKTIHLESLHQLEHSDVEIHLLNVILKSIDPENAKWLLAQIYPSRYRMPVFLLPSTQERDEASEDDE